MKPRLITLFALLFIAAAGTPMLASAQELRFRVPQLSVLLSADRGYVQQQIVQRVRLESNYPFARLKVEIGNPEHAEVIELQARKTRPFKTWANEGWVFETSRGLFPKRSGRLTVPAIRMTGKTELPGGESQPFDVSWPGATIDVLPASPKLDEEAWVVADSVSMTEQWSTPPDLARAGHVLTRTLRVRAAGTMAEHLPGLRMPAALGTAVIDGTVRRHNEVTDDTVIGHMTQSFEVRVLTDTKADISPVQLAWFDPRQATVKRSAVRAYRIEPLPANVEDIIFDIMRRAREEQQSSARQIAWLIVGGSVVVAVFAILLLLATPIRRHCGRFVARSASVLFGPVVSLPSVGIEPSDTIRKVPWTHHNISNDD